MFMPTHTFSHDSGQASLSVPLNAYTSKTLNIEHLRLRERIEEVALVVVVITMMVVMMTMVAAVVMMVVVMMPLIVVAMLLLMLMAVVTPIPTRTLTACQAVTRCQRVEAIVIVEQKKLHRRVAQLQTEMKDMLVNQGFFFWS